MIAQSNLNQFRFTSLRYRYLARHDHILTQLYQRADFARLWTQTRQSSATDLYSQLRRYDHLHPDYGLVSSTATTSSTITDYGNIYLIIHVPCDQRTFDVFNELNQTHQGVRTLMPWPDSLLEDATSC